MVEATIFISLVIVAMTQLIKMASAEVQGKVTIAVAFAVGVVVALIDGFIGVSDISIAQGIVAALGAIGLSSLATKAGGH